MTPTLAAIGDILTQMLEFLTEMATWIIKPANVIFMVSIAIGVVTTMFRLLRRFAGR